MIEQVASTDETNASGFVLAGGRSSRMGRDKALLSFAGRPLIAHALSILREAGLAAAIAGVPREESTAAGQIAGTNPKASDDREERSREEQSQEERSRQIGALAYFAPVVVAPVLVAPVLAPILVAPVLVAPALASFAPIVEDSERGFGPLAGICAALAAVATRYVVLLPVDLPLLPSSLIVYMIYYARITGRAVTVSSVNGFSQTFPVVLDRSILPALENDLNSGQRGCFSAFEAAAKGLGQPIASIAVELLVQSGQITHPLGLATAYWFLNMNTPQDLHRAEALMAHTIA